MTRLPVKSIVISQFILYTNLCGVGVGGGEATTCVNESLSVKGIGEVNGYFLVWVLSFGANGQTLN